MMPSKVSTVNTTMTMDGRFIDISAIFMI